MNVQIHTTRAIRVCGSVLLAAFLSACGGSGQPDAPQSPAPPPTAGGPTNFQAATVALGQPTLESSLYNEGRDAGASRTSLASPAGLALTPQGGLLVADAENNRVLLFDSVPEAIGAAAAEVLGQSGFETTDPSLTRDGFSLPTAIAVGAGKMAVAEWGSSRVVIYDTTPAPSQVPRPVAVLGQPNFESDGGGCGPGGLNRPSGLAITPKGKLIVADTANHRVLVWNEVPTSMPPPAPTLILGQGTPNNCQRNENGSHDNARADTFAGPVDVWSDDQVLVIADTGNSRVLIWTDFPTGNQQPATVVLGHKSFTDAKPNSEEGGITLGHPTAHTLHHPYGVHSDGVSLAVVDNGNNRVLFWRSIPKASFTAADVVLGHADFERSVADDRNGDLIPDAPTARNLYFPGRVLVTPTSLVVSDSGHNRVLVYPR